MPVKLATQDVLLESAIANLSRARSCLKNPDPDGEEGWRRSFQEASSCIKMALGELQSLSDGGRYQLDIEAFVMANIARQGARPSIGTHAPKPRYGHNKVRK
jgi:hypothetical protein